MKKTPLVQLQSIYKRFDENDILSDLSLEIYEGEFLTLLGPSGCGKTTTLRILAGLEHADRGRVLLDGKDISSLPPEKRPINTVFQNYALFPHMNVFQNVAYGLKLQGVKKQEQQERVQKVLSMVQLSGYEKRMSSQLSGGQRQRVAIARALVLEPKLLLLDEPLGALDLKLRQEMQHELQSLQQALGITFLYITHDQEEALNMSSRIVVMQKGKIEQLGTPNDIYEHPKTLFVADFIGQNNLLYGKLTERKADGNATMMMNGLSLPVKLPLDVATSLQDEVVLCLRPHRIYYGNQQKHGINLQGTVEKITYIGGMQHTSISLCAKATITAISQMEDAQKYQKGDSVYVSWDPSHAPLVPHQSIDGMKLAGGM